MVNPFSDKSLSSHMYRKKELVIARTPLLRAVRDANMEELNEVLRLALAEGSSEGKVESGGDKNHPANLSVHVRSDQIQQILLNTVGLFGETALHLAVLYHSDQHQMIAKYLVDLGGPQLVNAIMTCELTKGETALHTAIMKRDTELVSFLIRSGADLQARASGTFFTHTGECYYGEYPLSFAVSVGQAEIVQLLLERGADIFAADSHGNTAAHMAMWHNQGSMYKVLKKYQQESIPTSGPSEDRNKMKRSSTQLLLEPAAVGIGDRENKDGDTPWTLAAERASLETFTALLQCEKQVLWTYNCTQSCGFPMNALRRALETVVEHKRSDLMAEPLMKMAIQELWEMGGKRFFISHLFPTVIYLLFFSLAVQLCDYEDTESTVITCPGEGMAILSVCLPIAILNAAFSLYSFGAKLKRQKGRALESLRRSFQGPNLFLFLEWVHTGCLIYAFQAILFETEAEAMSALGVGTIVGWFSLLYYASAMSISGQFVAIILRILTHDIMSFVWLYGLSLIAFALTMLALFKSSASEGFSDIGQAVHTLVLTSVGYFDTSEYLLARSPNVARGLFFTFIVINNFALMSLLVAMMFDTFAILGSTRDGIYLLQRAAMILDLERRHNANFILQSDSSNRSSVWSFLSDRFRLFIPFGLGSKKWERVQIQGLPPKDLGESGKEGFRSVRHSLSIDNSIQHFEHTTWILMNSITPEERDALLEEERRKKYLKEVVLERVKTKFLSKVIAQREAKQ